jgi:hypothetical protein
VGGGTGDFQLILFVSGKGSLCSEAFCQHCCAMCWCCRRENILEAVRRFKDVYGKK